MSLVSIIIPYYNKTTTINRSVNSVLNQTYPNWELIIIDDCSNKPIQIEQKDERITILRNQKNLGPGLTRQQGLNLAKGEFLAFLDADDWWDDSFLEKSIRKYEYGFAAVWSQTILINEDKTSLKNFNLVNHVSLKRCLLDFGHSICTSSFLWRREFVTFWTSLSTQQDSMFELENSKLNDRIVPLGIALVYQDKTGEEHREKYVKQVENLFNKFLVYKEFKNCKGLSRLDNLKLFQWYYRLYLKLDSLDHEKSKEIKEFISDEYFFSNPRIMKLINLALYLVGINIAFGNSTLTFLKKSNT